MGFSLIFCYNLYCRVVLAVQLFFKQAFPFSSLEGNPYLRIRNYPTWQHYIKQNKVLNRTFVFQTDNSNNGPIKTKIIFGPILPLPGASLEPDNSSSQWVSTVCESTYPGPEVKKKKLKKNQEQVWAAEVIMHPVCTWKQLHNQVKEPQVYKYLIPAFLTRIT